MSLTTRLLLVVPLLVCVSPWPANAQMFTDQGVMSGSGLTLMPTATVAPPSEMQLQFTRMGLTDGSANRLNLVGLTWGLSSSVEGYARLTSEEVGTVSSQISYSIGGKFRFPGSVPLLRRLAFWGEATVSDMDAQNRTLLIPVKAVRAAAIASLDSNGFHPTFLLGVCRAQEVIRPMVGGGLTIALGHPAQLGVEFIQGYLGRRSAQAMITGSVRIFSNVSLHVSPGYATTPALNSWIISGGISISTADIDYHQVRESTEEQDEFKLPSIEELEKQSQQDHQQEEKK